MIFINSSNITYREAEAADFESISSILNLSGLPNKDIHPLRQHFIIAEIMGKIVGCAAIEVHGNYGLFRSLAVIDAFRNLKVGSGLLNRIIQLSKNMELNELFLLTTTAPDYFRRAGWEQISRNEVPTQIAESTEFTSICPSTAICMNKQLFQ